MTIEFAKEIVPNPYYASGEKINWLSFRGECLVEVFHPSVIKEPDKIPSDNNFSIFIHVI